MDKDAEKRDEVLKRLLKTPPKPQKPSRKGGAAIPDDDPMPTDDPEALIEWGKRHIQGD